MVRLQEIRVGVQSIERFRGLLDDAELDEALRVGLAAQRRLAKRVVWNVNSTGAGGGVAEMLQSLLSYARGLGIDARWMVIEGNPEFFRITKRIHHALHGSAGDGSALGEREHRVYEETLRENALELGLRVQPRDIVLLHDPQTAGLAPHLGATGAHLVWRCHVGSDGTNEHVEAAWAFLEPYLRHVPHHVFSREVYVPRVCDHGKSAVIHPSIDPFSAKNQPLDEATVRTILVHTGLVEGPPPEVADHGFLRDDGTPSRVERRADVLRCGRAPAWDTPLVVQVSRWDPLKDMLGVMHGFARLADGSTPAGAELVLAGPNVNAVADDPEAAAVFDEVATAWRALPQSIRNRVHLASLPMADVQENAAIVNALQRHASVVVQKSLGEGFGLTVAEAMWKGRPVLASAVGGIPEQVEDDVSGVLLKDPRDLDDFAAALRGLLTDRSRAEALGRGAQARVRAKLLGVDHLLKYARLFAALDGG